VRILGVLLNEAVETGGHRRYIELLDGLAIKGNQVVVLCSEEVAQFIHAATATVQPAIIKPRSKARRFLQQARTWVKQSQDLNVFDWVIIFGETNALAGIFMARHFRARLLFAYRSNTVESMRIQRRHCDLTLKEYMRSWTWQFKIHAYEQLIARKSKIIVFQSSTDRDEIAHRIPWAKSKMTIIPGNIGEPRFSERYRNTNTSTHLSRLLVIGVLTWRKGVDVLLNVMALVVTNIPDLHLDIIGFGEEEANLHRLVDELGLAHHVTFHGRINEPLAMMAAADLIVVPSLFDSFPNTVLEALHVGTPIVGSRVGGIPHQIGSDEYLFPPGDVQALAQIITDLATDSARYERAREFARERAEIFRFDWIAAWEESMKATP